MLATAPNRGPEPVHKHNRGTQPETFLAQKVAMQQLPHNTTGKIQVHQTIHHNIST